jgi:hypothetical protein
LVSVHLYKKEEGINKKPLLKRGFLLVLNEKSFGCAFMDRRIHIAHSGCKLLYASFSFSVLAVITASWFRVTAIHNNNKSC